MFVVFMLIIKIFGLIVVRIDFYMGCGKVI